MLKDLIIIPNFFDNPNQIVEIAKQQQYYIVEDHPEDRNSRVWWGGNRTEKLESILNESINNLINETITKKILCSNLPDNTNSSITYLSTAYFHYFTEDYKSDERNLHQDSGLYAGVIYLNDCHLDTPNNHGTIILNKSNDSFIMPYEYNTAIFYRSDFIHSPLSGFGSNVDNARLSISFIINKLVYDLHRNTL